MRDVVAMADLYRVMLFQGGGNVSGGCTRDVA